MLLPRAHASVLSALLLAALLLGVTAPVSAEDAAGADVGSRSATVVFPDIEGINPDRDEYVVEVIRALPKLAYLTLDGNDFDAVGQAALIRAAKAHPLLDATLDFEAPEPKQSLNHGYGSDGCTASCREEACAIQ